MLEIIKNEPLGPLTTLGVGGAAKYFVRATSEQELLEAFNRASERGLAVFVLGGGSNLVVSDAGFDGLVIQVSLRGVSFEEMNDGIVRVRAAAGEGWDALVRYCVEADLAGIECLSGIPGLVGGSPVQNVGAYGQEVAESISSVRCLDRRNLQFIQLSNLECGFAYRSSIFNTAERERYVITSVAFDLKRGGNPRVSYRDLRERFIDTVPSLIETREAVLDIRRKKSMVIDPLDRNSRSAGSFFKNPVVRTETLEKIREVAGVSSVPSFPAGEGCVKVSAAWLIDRTGFVKGYRRGNAGISEKHSLAIVNFGGATAADVVGLKNEIQEAVNDRFNIVLEPEPTFVGG